MSFEDPISTTCRLCARCDSPNMKNAFKILDSDNMNVAFIVNKYLGISFSTEDKNVDICVPCFDTVLEFHMFAKKCLEAQKLFKRSAITETVDDHFKPWEAESSINAFECDVGKKELDQLDVAAVDESDTINVSKDVEDLHSDSGDNTKEDIESLPSLLETRTSKVRKKILKVKRKKRKQREKPKFKCSTCSRLLATKECLDKHEMRHIPKDQRIYKCSTCEKMFKCRESLLSHEKIHIPREERYTHTCEICQRKFTAKASLRKHIRDVHDKIKRFVCDICGVACCRKAQLAQHQAIHSDEKLFQCPLCPKAFKVNSTLKGHMNTHSGLSFKCEYCSKFLSSRKTLKRHMLLHDDSHQHVCLQCNRSFKRKETLKVHFMTHTGERPVSCLWCPQKFAYECLFRSHCQKAHPQNFLELNKAPS